MPTQTMASSTTYWLTKNMVFCCTIKCDAVSRIYQYIYIPLVWSRIMLRFNERLESKYFSCKTVSWLVPYFKILSLLFTLSHHLVQIPLHLEKRRYRFDQRPYPITTRTHVWLPLTLSQWRLVFADSRNE